ncbi:NADH dehydrogenase (ubiquinone) complex I, assembly factor 6, partial [Asbolus verrucosus]
THDYENFISSILLKQTARSCAFAVRSFNVEIARIAEQVSQKSIGLMRMQFWDDTLDKCFMNDFKKVPQNPVAIELFNAVKTCKLTKRYLKNLIISRKENLNSNGFHNLEDMEKYCELSVSSVYYLILEGSKIKNLDADHAASHLGKAQGIVQQLRNIPHTQKLNFIPVPQAILTKNNVNHEELLRSRSSKPLSDCVYEVASRAYQHLSKSRSLEKKVPPEGRRAFLSAVAIAAYLDKLQKVDYDVFHPRLKHREWTLLPKIWLASFKNRY